MSSITSKTSNRKDSFEQASKEIPSKWQGFKDSFKRAESSSSPTTQNLTDVEKAIEQTAKSPLKKNLKKRQLQMIAIGGAIGTGLFIGSGTALRTGGPAALLIGWGIVATFLYCTMQAMAELVALFPVSGSFSTYATRFIEPSWGFAVGWNYAIFWVIVLPLELVACSLTIKFWESSINSVAWVAIFYVFIMVLNLCGNKGFGEAEFIFSIIKVVAIIGFNILAIVIICGGSPKGGYVGAKYWHDPGAFTAGFKGVVTVFITATYSFAGTELVGLTAAESEGNPRIVLPKAIKQVFYRIIIFYMLTLTLVGFLVPSNSTELIGSSSDSSASPFVIAIRNGGIQALPSIFNAVVLISLLSIGNASVYGFSRTIVALGEQGLAPSIFAYIDREGRPLVGFLLCAIVGLLSFVAASPVQSTVLAWLLALAGLSTLFTWFSICVAHVRFRMALKHQGRSTEELPYIAKTGMWGSIYSAVMLVIVLCLQFWVSLYPIGESPNASTFFENYIGAVVVLVFYVGHKLYTKNLKIIIPVNELDIDSGRRDTDLDKLQQEILEEKEKLAAQPWYIRLRAFLF
ncbi:amino-acid permease Gap6p [[Candida] railenensis]|uniref:Amino-acid permease Gap6p n=1 Tax=[Candida] railenensis TaxID=45579 RepID=A0A9P0VY78_9ASCO|nr:amino-acid permease Gap6p [[Candida] railenensis]